MYNVHVLLHQQIENVLFYSRRENSLQSGSLFIIHVSNMFTYTIVDSSRVLILNNEYLRNGLRGVCV